jgi:class 3 adenylate cyclase
VDELESAFLCQQTLINQIESIIKHVGADRSSSVEVLGILDNWPALVRQTEPRPDWTGFKYVPYPTGNELKDQEALMAAGFKPPATFNIDRNETIGLVCEVAADGRSIDYYPITYQTKLALIEHSRPHATLSAGAVILDRDRRELLLHVRSKVRNMVYEAAGRTHCFLGSVRVPSFDPKYEADMSLMAGAGRECLEECGSNVDLKGGQIAIVKWSQDQPDGGRVLRHTGLDLVYLGAEATNSNLLKTRAQYYEQFPESQKWEGHVEPIALEEDAIFHQFTTQSRDWFPPGIAHHLLWLGLGAFGAPAAFAGRSRALYARILDYYATRGVTERRVTKAIQARQAEKDNPDTQVSLAAVPEAELDKWTGGAEVLNVAIVFTDIVDSTTLCNELTDAVWDTILHQHFARAKRLIDQKKGILINKSGDSILALFHDATSAVLFAVAIHDDTGHAAVRIRAGVHSGEVSIHKGDAGGRHVNLTSRVMSYTKADGVVASDRIKEDVSRRGELISEKLRWTKFPDVTLQGFSVPETLWGVEAVT